MFNFIFLVVVIGVIVFYLLSKESSDKEENRELEKQQALERLEEQRRIEKMNKIPISARCCFGCKNAKIYNDDVEPMLFECHRKEVNCVVQERKGCPYYDPMLGSFIK